MYGEAYWDGFMQKKGIEDELKMQKKSIAVNYILNTTYQILILIVPLITTPYISRVLGAEGIGVYSYTYSVVSYFLIVAAMGTTTYGQRTIAYYQDDKYKRSCKFFEILLFRALTTGVCSIGYIWYMPKKEDVVSEIIEKAVPVPDNSAQDYSDVPVYYEPFSYAKENDEVDLYRTSYRLNSECKQAIHEAIADNYDGMYLGDDAVDQVVRQYGMERVGYILANTLHHKSYDGRFSHGNKEWAEQVSTPEHNADRMTFRTDWVVDSHPAILDGFVTMFRKELDAQKEQEQPFVKQFYVVENLQAAPLRIERFGNLDDAMSQYQALPNHYMKAFGVEKNPDPLSGSLDILQCRNGIDTIVEDYKTVPGWDNPYINYFRDDQLVQQAISDMEKLMEARQKSKEQERSSTKKSVLDALRSLKTKKQEQPAQEQDKPKKAKKKGMEL